MAPVCREIVVNGVTGCKIYNQYREVGHNGLNPRKGLTTRR